MKKRILLLKLLFSFVVLNGQPKQGVNWFRQRSNLIAMTRIKKIYNTFFFIILSFPINNCSEVSEREVIVVTNEMSFCEDIQVFWKVIDEKNVLNLSERGISSTVYVKFKYPQEDSNYFYRQLFFPAHQDTRYKVTLRGSFRKEKLHNQSYGCLGSSIFIAEKVLNYQDVTKTDTFQINYQY